LIWIGTVTVAVVVAFAGCFGDVSFPRDLRFQGKNDATSDENRDHEDNGHLTTECNASPFEGDQMGVGHDLANVRPFVRRFDIDQ
jgi:hypothetical protein